MGRIQKGLKSMMPDPMNRTVKIPIKIVNGYPCLLPTSRLLELKDGTIGDLIVPESVFVDSKVAEAYNQESKKPFFPEGTQLLAQVNSEHVPQHLWDHLVKGSLGAGVAFNLMEEQ
jgi:hypothetical protein